MSKTATKRWINNLTAQQRPTMQNHSTINDNLRMPTSHPVLAQITINVIDFHNFCLMAERNFDTNIVGYDDLKDGRMIVYVACASQETVDRLVHAWC